jgi:O-antigen/teichoic acid export membrane protein
VKAYKNLFKISVLPHLIILLIAPHLFKILFGENWIISGHMTQIMLPAMFFSFLNSPLTNLSQILNKQKNLLFFELIQLIIVGGLIMLSAHLFHNILITIGAMSFGLTLYHLFLLSYLMKIAKNVDHKDVYAS